MRRTRACYFIMECYVISKGLAWIGCVRPHGVTPFGRRSAQLGMSHQRNRSASVCNASSQGRKSFFLTQLPGVHGDRGKRRAKSEKIASILFDCTTDGGAGRGGLLRVALVHTSMRQRAKFHPMASFSGFCRDAAGRRLRECYVA